ncbi:MAG: DNA mismatch repair endonuclease MutL [bacterium]|nr:DNA mismatch repair endonuclease MutL [bacterium]
MANKIQILPVSISSRIAAGEVIERPASVIKELLENSLDAKATQIEVWAEAGGKELIRVADNGDGLLPDEAALAFERYATSKIREEEDLERIDTFGFRGEALPSIAQISRVTLTSRSRSGKADRDVSNPDSGVRVQFSGGEFQGETRVPSTEGTEITVTDLFFNTPVRRKFLRGDETEGRHIFQLVTKVALSNPEVGFRLCLDGKEVILAPARKDLKERVADLLGEKETAKLLPVDYEVSSHRVTGFCGAPDLQKSSSQSIYTWVNRRVITDRILIRSLADGYGMMLAKGKYPMAVLFLQVPPGEVDVNIHPAKLEVRFRNPGLVHHLVKRAVELALGRAFPETASAGISLNPEDLQKSGRDGAVYPAGSSFRETAVPFLSGTVPRPVSQELFRREKREGFFNSLKVIGQLKGTYILCQSERGLVIIDQHAAHERISFARLSENWSRASGELEELLIPVNLELRYDQARLLSEVLPTVRRLGMEVEPLGGNSFLVRAVNRRLLSAGYEAILQDILEELSLLPNPDALVEGNLEPVIARMACHGSVQAHRVLDRGEMESLLEELQEVEQSPFCPHGRPVFFEITEEELEKRFRRT